MNVGIVGLGLIGGSIALECKAMGYKVYGADNNADHLELALQNDLIDEVLHVDMGPQPNMLFILAIPVDQIEKLLSSILDNIHPTSTVIDVGSTKMAICDAVRGHQNRSRYVAAHPLSGTEFSGPTAALMHLFKNKKNIICEEDLSAEDALEVALKLFNDLGMQSLFMNPFGHDKHMAYVSHLSHVSSFTLSQTVLNIENDEKQIFNLASTGFESTVRLAKSSPETWSSIFVKNSDHLSRALGEYIQNLQKIKDVIDAKDKSSIKNVLEESNDIKRVLKGLKLNIVKLS